MPRTAKMLPSSLAVRHDSVLVGVASTEIVKANEKRRYLCIQNVSDEVMYLRIGSHVSTTTGIMLAPGYDETAGRDYNASSRYEMRANENLFVDAVYAICGTAGKRIQIIEGAATGETGTAATGGQDGVSSSSSSSSESSSSSDSSDSSSSDSSESSSESASSSST